MTQRNITAFFSKASNVKSVSENEESVICDFSQSKESDITSQKCKSPNLTSKQNGDNVPNKRKRSPSGKRGSPEKNTTNKKSTSEKNKISLQSCEQNEKSPTESKQRANSLNIGKWLVATNEGRNNTGDSDEEIVPVKQRSRKMAKIESDDSSGGEETINSETKQTDNSETIPNQTAKIISEVDKSMKKETSRDGSVENEILEDKREETESSDDNSEESESSEDKSEEDESSEDKSLKIKTINVELPNKGKQIKIKITADLNVSSDKYKPSKSNYHPINDATWKHGEKVPYLALAHTLEQIEAVSSRLKIIEILSNFFRSVIVLTPDDLLPSIYLCLNKLAPAYENLELGVAETTLLKAIAQTTGRSIAQLKSDVKAAGDIGIVAEQSRSNQKLMFQPAPLTVRGVFEMLKKLAEMSGISTVSKKVGKIQSIFVACRQSEARYFIRSLAGKLRIGLAEQSVLQALAQALVTTPPGQDYPPKILNFASSVSADAFKSKLDKQALIIKTTYCECPSYDKIVPVILKEGVEALPQHCRLTPGIPLKPMLAQPTKGVSEVLQRFEGLRFTCEWKYDGERAQIHVDGTKVYIFSRNQENNTTKYPDITTRLNQCICPGVSSCVLDTEVVAWDTQNKRILPFQVLSTRKRKDCSESEIKVAVCVYIFDLLYLNGESLVKKPLSERRKMLLENFMVVDERFYFATNLDTSTMEEVQDFLEDAVKGNCEGLMVKTLETEATYEIAKRSRNWLKLKKDYLEGVGDTLDVVVIGGYQGRGKRTGVYGGFLLACYDEENEEYQSICKIGTGFSEEDLQKHSEFMKEHIIDAPRPYYRYDISHEPDHWFDPVQVWEIKCADLSLSPVHRAAQGIVDPEKGISLRFPRFVRIRDDKSVEQATSAKQVADMYKNQDQIKNQQGTDKFTEEDFY